VLPWAIPLFWDHC
jgi:hypothetical protein